SAHWLSADTTSAPRVLLFFPTRRSSDLGYCRCSMPRPRSVGPVRTEPASVADVLATSYPLAGADPPVAAGSASQRRIRGPVLVRSEEHTSELQSRFDLVCRLLLDKKKHD